MAELETELRGLVKGEKDSETLYEWLDAEIHGWDYWYSDLLHQNERQAAQELEKTGFVQDASLNREWLKPLRNDRGVVGAERQKNPGLYDAVSELVKIYFDERFAPKGASFNDAVDTVFWRMVTWKDWLPAEIQADDEKLYEDDTDYGPDEDQVDLGL